MPPPGLSPPSHGRTLNSSHRCFVSGCPHLGGGRRGDPTGPHNGGRKCGCPGRLDFRPRGQAPRAANRKRSGGTGGERMQMERVYRNTRESATEAAREKREPSAAKPGAQGREGKARSVRPGGKEFGMSRFIAGLDVCLYPQRKHLACRRATAYSDCCSATPCSRSEASHCWSPGVTDSLGSPCGLEETAGEVIFDRMPTIHHQKLMT